MEEHQHHLAEKPDSQVETQAAHPPQHNLAAHQLEMAHAGRSHEPTHQPGHGESLPAHTLSQEASSHTGHDRQAHADHTGHEQLFRRRFWVCLVLSIPVLLYSPMLQMLLGFSMPAFPGNQWIPLVISVVIFIYGGTPFLRLAVPEIRNRQPGMMTLVSLGISAAFLYSLAAFLFNLGEDFFWELVTLIDIMLLGHWLEMRSVRQASGALNELARLMPDTADRILPNGQLETIPVSGLKTRDLVLIRPGTAVPADGEIIEGSSDVNEAMITGESLPVKKRPGDRVIAGTINTDGSLRVKVTATGEATTLAGIMRLVEQAQQSKSRTQVLADKAAGWLFYIALAASFLTLVGWGLTSGVDQEVFQRVVTVLVIACPHALGLAIPLVVAITTAIGAQNGILVRDRLASEKARLLDMVIFDKTGTLTKGEQGVVSMAVQEQTTSPDEALALAAAVEGDSEHIIAQAIRQKAAESEVPIPAVDQFKALKGRGVQAIYQDKKIYVGSPGLLELLEITLPETLNRFTETANQRGQTVVYLVVEKQAQAALALADVIRPESREAVGRLQALGVEVAMLTGDSRAVAAAVAKDLGIRQYAAEVLPENKEQEVRKFQEQGKLVAMVGDGVNDAPALVRADVGIAIGSGTDVAVESAGIILVKNNPLDVVRAIELSRASYRKMQQNLFWATGYNLVAIPLAAGLLAPWGVDLTPAVGALLMSLSTVVVAVNAQLLRRLVL